MEVATLKIPIKEIVEGKKIPKTIYIYDEDNEAFNQKLRSTTMSIADIIHEILKQL